MSSIHHIAVLLPERYPHPNDVWLDWVGRQRIDSEAQISHSLSLRRCIAQDWLGRTWKAHGISDPLHVQGYQFDEVVIAHPQVSHDLIQAALTVLR